MTLEDEEGRGVTAISLGEVCSDLRSGDVRMGKPNIVINYIIPDFNRGGELGEVKHFSSRRNREKLYSLSSGERKGKSPNLVRISQEIFIRGSKIVTSGEIPGSKYKTKTSLVERDGKPYRRR